MKRQITACIFVGLALLILFKGVEIARSGWWLVSQTLPGGLTVHYYKDKDLSVYVCKRTERQVTKMYESGRPAWGVPHSNFSASWEGFLLVPQDAEYKFYMQSDDGSRLYIDNDKVIDRWDDHGWVPGSHGGKVLSSGKHSIRVEHYNAGGEAGIRLRWFGGPIPADTIVATPYITKR